MRIAIVTESFPPDVNGVAHSVVRAAEHLVARGHEPLVIAPAPPGTRRRDTDRYPYPVVRIPSVPLPRYQGFRLGVPTNNRLAGVLLEHSPDVVHLASPFILGARAATLAARHGLPTVAVYQTDVAAYARAYRVGWGGPRPGGGCGRSTTRPAVPWPPPPGPPRTSPRTACSGSGCGVGASTRSASTRTSVARVCAGPSPPTGNCWSVTWDGSPRRSGSTCSPPPPDCRASGSWSPVTARPAALGVQHGEALARLYASLDLFVHTGPHETFGQTIQEALASGVPVVAPASGGPVDLVTPGQTGELVPPGDDAAIAETAPAPASPSTCRRRRDRQPPGGHQHDQEHRRHHHDPGRGHPRRRAADRPAGQLRHRHLRRATHRVAAAGRGLPGAGHDPVLVVPGRRDDDERHPWGRVVTLAGPPLPHSGGYRLLTARRRLARLLTTLAPDRLEVSDRATLRWTGDWARENCVPSVMVSHESLTGLLTAWGLPGPLGRRIADRLNADTARRYDRIVCTTRWAAEEFARIGVPHVDLVPLGVDLDTFHPGRADPAVRDRYAGPGEVLLVHCARLSVENRVAPRCNAARPVSPSPSPASCPTVVPSRRCWPAPTWSWPRARWRPSVWPGWRRWPAVPRWW